MPTLTTSDGARLAYQERGTGRTLLLLHGWSQSAAMLASGLVAGESLMGILVAVLVAFGLLTK